MDPHHAGRVSIVGLYETATGRLLSVGTAPEVVPATMALAPLPEGATYAITHEWDAGARAWAVKGPPEVTVLSAGDFMRRLGFEREVALRMAMRDPATPLLLVARLDTLSAWLNRIVTTGVDLDDPVVANGTALMATVLHEKGLLPEGPEAFSAGMLRRTP